MTTQEPVAWYRDENGIRMYYDAPYFDDATPLYSAQRECSVELIRENEDGSADFQFNLPPETIQAFARLGIITALKAGIEDAKRLNPDEGKTNDT